LIDNFLFSLFFCLSWRSCQAKNSPGFAICFSLRGLEFG